MESNTLLGRSGRHFAGPLARLRNSDKRGAALILEIIIYLVIVALIAVAVISGVRAIRDLVFTSHAKGDIQQVQSWVEGKYTQDNVYPASGPISYTAGSAGPPVVPATGFADAPSLTKVGTDQNTASITSVNSSGNYGYCIVVISKTISDPNKSKFWLASNNPSQIYQSGTATNGGATTPPASTNTGGISCPAS